MGPWLLQMSEEGPGVLSLLAQYLAPLACLPLSTASAESEAAIPRPARCSLGKRPARSPRSRLTRGCRSSACAGCLSQVVFSAAPVAKLFPAAVCGT